ncbi:hypothetical protein BIW11_08062 [Tropilaelaps mercedesae]|uniref:HIT-type domain-containing protein n=1 Tax=Tropilaelaps mercedesae TaxID=418985 RepID=A0A1V9XR75_9ACAR|nr:hypothetical protein BIW11_08062 [Tropilaelaps mercedesae]
MPCCHFCKSPASPYVCPRCTLPYCSLSCYRCTDHSGCSEEFYRECVEIEMKKQVSDDTDKRKIQAALLRERRTAFEHDALESRLAAVDLDNTDEVLRAMTNEEVRTFDRLVESEEIAKYIPVWKPWWTNAKRLVEEVTTNQQARPSDVQHSMVGFRKIRKQARSRLGGKKVKNLSSKTAKGSGSSDVDDVTNDKERLETTGQGRNRNVLEGDRLDERVDLRGDLSKIQERQEISGKLTIVNRGGDQSDKKTRIVDTRYRGTHVSSTETNGTENLNDNTGRKLNVLNDPSSQPLLPRSDKPVELKVADYQSYDAKPAAAANAVGACQQSTTQFRTDAQSGNDPVRRTGANKLAQKPLGFRKTLLSDSWADVPDDLNQPPIWGHREKVLAANLVNIVAAYVFIARFFNGDFVGDEVEAVELLQSICSVFKGQNFQTVDIALIDVLLQDVVVSTACGTLLTSDVSLVLSTSEYAQRALFETRSLLKTARRRLGEQICLKTAESCVPEQDHSNEIRSGRVDHKAHLSDLKLLMLKVDFYFNWATYNMTKLQRWTLPIIALEKEKLELDRTTER